MEFSTLERDHSGDVFQVIPVVILVSWVNSLGRTAHLSSSIFLNRLQHITLQDLLLTETLLDLTHLLQHLFIPVLLPLNQRHWANLSPLDPVLTLIHLLFVLVHLPKDLAERKVLLQLVLAKLLVFLLYLELFYLL